MLFERFEVGLQDVESIIMYITHQSSKHDGAFGTGSQWDYENGFYGHTTKAII